MTLTCLKTNPFSFIWPGRIGQHAVNEWIWMKTIRLNSLMCGYVRLSWEKFFSASPWWQCGNTQPPLHPSQSMKEC
jgi:hypothetical protein